MNVFVTGATGWVGSAVVCEQDHRVIEALGSVLAGSSRPLLVTSGLLGLPRGASEMAQPNPASPRKSETAARAVAERGVRAATIRLAPSVHGIGDWGFVPILIRIANVSALRKKACAAAIPRSLRKRKSIVLPCLSTAR